MKYHYYLIYKPFGILSQFSDEGARKGLSHLYQFPKDVYPVGRLDADSEGLLILTNDNHLKHQILEPKFAHQKIYLAQVEGEITQDALNQLRQGVTIKVNKKPYKTKPSKVEIISEPQLPERHPPIRYRKSVPTTWISITITEGKNRQVRKMTAKVGYPTLRLVRMAIEDLFIDQRQSGEVWTLSQQEIYRLAKVSKK